MMALCKMKQKSCLRGPIFIDFARLFREVPTFCSDAIARGSDALLAQPVTLGLADLRGAGFAEIVEMDAEGFPRCPTGD